MRDTLTPFHDENLFAPTRTFMQTNKAEPMLLALNRLVKNWAQARDIFDVPPMSTQTNTWQWRYIALREIPMKRIKGNPFVLFYIMCLRMLSTPIILIFHYEKIWTSLLTCQGKAQSIFIHLSPTFVSFQGIKLFYRYRKKKARQVNFALLAMISQTKTIIVKWTITSKTWHAL